MASYSCLFLAFLSVSYIEADSLMSASSFSRVSRIVSTFQAMRRETPQLSHRVTAFPHAHRADAVCHECSTGLNTSQTFMKRFIWNCRNSFGFLLCRSSTWDTRHKQQQYLVCEYLKAKKSAEVIHEVTVNALHNSEKYCKLFLCYY